MYRTPVLAVGLVLSLASAGCYSTWDIPSREMKRLDGYRAPATNVVFDTKGEAVNVDPDTQFTFRACSNDEQGTLACRDLSGRFDSIEVHTAPNGLSLTGILHDDGHAMRVDLTKQQIVLASRYSHGKTAALVIPLVAVGVTAIVVASIFAATAPLYKE